MHLVTAGQMQNIDKQTIESFGLPGLVLMENAGRGAVEFLVEKYGDLKRKKVAILCGRGNNGGDGFVIARYLMNKDIRVTAFLLSSVSKVTGDARVNLDLFQKLCDSKKEKCIIEIVDQDSFDKQKKHLLHHDLFVDALLGTGLNSDVRGYYKTAIDLMNNSPSPTFSIDIPSGLNSDTGKPMGISVTADATATFAFAKIGHILHPGNVYTGDLGIVDIGIPHYISQKEKLTVSLLEPSDIAAKFIPRDFGAHKGSFGHLLVIAGSAGKTGAAALCSNAAMRCGTGLVTLGLAKSLNKRMEPAVIEPMTHPLPEKHKGHLSDNCLDDIVALMKDKQAIAIGPGIGTRKGTAKLVRKLIKKSQIPLILDADAINCIADDPGILNKKQAPVVLTPHPGEMSRLCKKTTAQIQEDRLAIASNFATAHDVTLVLKGAQTIIALPDGGAYICPTGNPGMASGGMGDVLTGMIAGFCAQGFSCEDAGLAGVYIHGMDADILSEQMGEFGFLASDLVQNLPKTIQTLLS